MNSTAHQINETHLGTDATREQAELMATRLTEAGYPAEYNSSQGIESRIRNEDGDIEIPDSVWFDCLQKVEEAAE